MSCRCGGSYPMSVQLRIVALHAAISAGSPSYAADGGNPRGVTAEINDRAVQFEKFLLGTHTAESLDAMSRQSMQSVVVGEQREQRQALLHVLVGVDADGVVRVIKPEQTGPMPAMITMTVAEVIKHRWSHEQAAGVAEFLALHGLRRYMSDDDIAKWIADGSATGIVDYVA